MPEEEQQQSSLNEILDRLFRILIRRRWCIVAPFFFVSLATLVGLNFLPNRYTSTASLLVVAQQVPQRYVVPNSETDLISALQAMKQEVLSRSQLLRMINEFGLYPKERKRLAPDQLAELMSRNIEIVPIEENPQKREKGFDSFNISFTTENPLLAQQVTTNLTSLFINEYLRTGTEQSTKTTNFLHEQVEQKSKELQAQEERLRDFKLSHVGELPEQQPGNLGILTGLQTQLQSASASLERAQQQRALLQAQLEVTPVHRSSETGPPIFIPGSPVPQGASPIEIAQAELNRLEAVKSSYLSKGYTAQHPDVLTNAREIAQAQAALQRLKAAAPPPEKASPAPQPGAAPTRTVAPPDDPVVGQLKASLEANRVEIENLTKDEVRLKAQISQYENRINQTPVREQQQSSIVRDTEVLRQEYSELLKREQESQLATNLEKQQGGQQFRLVDPASLPSLPSSPKRGKIALGGVGAGIGLGLVLALLIELLDTSFHSEKDLTQALAPPFVLGVPLLRTRREDRRLKFRGLVEWLAGSVMVVIVAAAEFYVYRKG